MTQWLLRRLDDVWLLLIRLIRFAIGPAAALRSAKWLLWRIPRRAAARITWPTLDALPYRDEDAELWRTGRLRENGKLVQIDPVDYGGRYFALCGFWEPWTTDIIERFAGPGLLIDVGANYGYFSVLWLRSPGNTVIAVEPSPRFAPIVSANVASEGDRARVLEGVIGDRSGTVSFGGDGMLAKVVDPDSPGSYNVQMFTLSEIVERFAPGKEIEVLKIDAEGYDLRILQASRPLFESGRIRCVLWEKAGEDEEEAFIRFLSANGYRRILDSSMLGFQRA
jgi:FkbM family methyltransferase